MTPPRKGGAKKAGRGTTPVEVVRHKDKRKNIPTDELREFVAEDERTPKTTLYPRDPSLDPQLVWRGKDEQDQAGLEVPTVPIYIQEKVHPQVLIENLRRTAERPEDEPELSLFSDFNGIEFEDLIDFYKHEQNWSNRLILGDSLLVMTSLAEKEGLKGKVQTIFIDPPYGISFGSNWQVTTDQRRVRDGKVADLSRQPEQIRAFRDTWKDGIHSYLGYLRDRLTVARDLLNETGSAFVQIGDENVHLVRSLLDEVFGPENFVSLITVKKTGGAGSPAGGTLTLPAVSDYVVWYARARETMKYRQLHWPKGPGSAMAEAYGLVEERDGTRRRATAEELRSGRTEGRFFQLTTLTSETVREAQTTVFPVEVNGTTYTPARGGWKTNQVGMDRLRAAGRLMAQGRGLRYVRYLDDFPASPITNFWADTQSGSGMDKVYVVQTNTKVIERCVLMTSDPGDLVLDPTSGSGTTAVVAEEWGRRWIAVDTSRVAVALTRTRLAGLKLPYYLLADSDQGQRREEEITGRPGAQGPFEGDVRKGFVYRRVSHIMLKDIAQNPEIREGLSREEIEGAIARNSDQEYLFDQPYEDRKIVRVCGPFTVESLSPHRMLDTEQPPLPDSEEVAESSASFENTILANLQKAGVQNQVRDQRLMFDSLEPFPGVWINARGWFNDEAGETRSVAISLGPEYGTVGSDQIREAAKEALKGVGFDLLLVCGFAFDPRSTETAGEFKPTADGGWAITTEERKFGKLPLMLVRMNQDLSMGEDLLKQTGAGNLFTVFGEPDIVVERNGDGQVEVEVRGVDVYNPTTGEIRSDSAENIACWMIDTEYNGESFFVRHAYFAGPQTPSALKNDRTHPYRRLSEALKAEIDEEAWLSLYRTRSRPFAPPTTGQIAVKVINHHGDEVMKTYPVA